MSEPRVARQRSQQDQEVLEYLLALGLIEEIRPPLPPEGIREEHAPIQIAGKPISEEIIEGRR